MAGGKEPGRALRAAYRLAWLASNKFPISRFSKNSRSLEIKNLVLGREIYGALAGSISAC
jgi:hypothetical protein